MEHIVSLVSDAEGTKSCLKRVTAFETKKHRKKREGERERKKEMRKAAVKMGGYVRKVRPS